MSSINKIKVGGTVYTIADGTEPLIAPVQETLVASKAYAVGEQFIYNGNLYKATASIASGATITINGNCALADSIAEQVTKLNTALTMEDITSSFTFSSTFFRADADYSVLKFGKVVIINFMSSNPVTVNDNDVLISLNNDSYIPRFSRSISNARIGGSIVSIKYNANTKEWDIWTSATASGARLMGEIVYFYA